MVLFGLVTPTGIFVSLAFAGDISGPTTALLIALAAGMYVYACMRVCAVFTFNEVWLFVLLAARSSSLLGAFRWFALRVLPSVHRWTGTFVYVSLLEIVQPETASGRHTLLKLLVMGVGWGLMSMLALWV